VPPKNGPISMTSFLPLHIVLKNLYRKRRSFSDVSDGISLTLQRHFL
jgi:hypothetical protein